MNFTEAIVLAVEKVKAWIQSGGVKWDHVSDKPFVKVGGDTLTWDGNTEGLDNLLGFELPYYKVSDVVISASDVAEGFSLTLNDGSQCNFAPGESVGDLEGLGVMLSDYVASFSEADAAKAGFSAGTYFICADEIFVRSLTIPGYTGFAKEQIDPKVLPESLRFGKTQIAVHSGDLQLVYEEGMGAVNSVEWPEQNGLDIKKIRVVWNGTAYDCEQKINRDFGIAYFGNPGPLGLEDTGEPFFIQVDDVSLLVFDLSATEGYTIDVDISYSGVNRLSDEYIPLPIMFVLSASGETPEYLYHPGTDYNDASNRVTRQELLDYVSLGKAMWAGDGNAAELILAYVNAGDYAYVKSISATYYTAEYTA